MIRRTSRQRVPTVTRPVSEGMNQLGSGRAHAFVERNNPPGEPAAFGACPPASPRLPALNKHVPWYKLEAYLAERGRGSSDRSNSRRLQYHRESGPCFVIWSNVSFPHGKGFQGDSINDTYHTS